MPIAVFSQGDAPRLGKVLGDHLIDLSMADPVIPADIIGFLEAGQDAVTRFQAVDANAAEPIPLKDVCLHAPIVRPEKFLGIGMNYGEHAREASAAGYAEQTYQLWFNKQVSCISGPYDDVVMPAVSDHLDYEVELAVVIGKTCRHVAVDDAALVIGGYMVANDVSVRDWQRRSQTMTLGKSFDTHGPIGPWLTLAQEVADPHRLHLRMTVNGEVRQDDNTSHLIHNIYEQIAYLSTVMTLKPGDILATGTPSGVGAAHNPPKFLKVGDVMRAEVVGLGFLENHIVAEG
jgi:2-keto-4-pentenoate hydratase/2-oxohepta-3-ene-1,7-dioic acid hydratase in catechol pathway